MSEAFVAILFAYKWLYNFVKALDEIKKKIQTVLMPFVGSLEPLDHLLLRCEENSLCVQWVSFRTSVY